MRAILAAACAVSIAVPAAAQTNRSPDIVTQVRTVSDLAAICDPGWAGVARLEAIAYCQGFLTAAGQYHALTHPPGGRRPPLYCMPMPGPTVAEGGLAFAAWARANPTRGAEPALDGFIRWAQESHPCAPPTAAPTRRQGGGA